MIQTKLLRVLQERQVRRIGDDRVVDIDVRIISATNRSITQLVEQMDFRRDLMYRLDVLRLFLPPLRSREEDVQLLFLEFLARQSAQAGAAAPVLEPEARALLKEYPFIGNIRELRNIVERTFVLCQGERITREELFRVLYPPDLAAEPYAAPLRPERPAPRGGLPEPYSEEERIRRALERCGGKRQKAADLLGMDRSTLWRKMQKYHME